MISIKRFLEQKSTGAPSDRGILEASLQMGRLLLDGIATHLVRGHEVDWKALGRTLKGLIRRMDEPPSALGLLTIASEAVEALETYSESTARYLREENEQMQSMVAMLTDTVADLTGQSDASVARLQDIEQQIVRASGLDDIRVLSANLESCLAAVREAAAQQRNGYAETVKRLQGQIDAAHIRALLNSTKLPPEDSGMDLSGGTIDGEEATEVTPYVAVFRLQRAEHIATRFGENARHQMLSLIAQSLKIVMEPDDRLLRWKGTSLVMFLKSAATIREVRTRLSKAVTATGQQYIEVGKKSALLSVGVDWMVFPEAQCPTLDAVFAEVDSFLANSKPASSPLPEQKIGGINS